MARYKIAMKTDVLRYRIAKEVFGEIEDSDGVREYPSWEIFEKCLEQHKQLNQMKDQLALTEKALELACETLKPKTEFLTDETHTIIPPSKYIKYFKQQARKEMIEK